ncbi:hypothetical protein [Diaphorobacter aerolatus]|uniref:DNA primase/nucleoside triphosphatase C-terminal domain-containing protein n=1 Tax=Diaphorobacter aerolatus TaxID=1288495 RepID=A0A7H0GJD8_9BURK|nr:hypothetical protein [Diaphorobacter aerolatus]QNP48404.1 hypothetical protein H9K75_21015 [Diaphorobacter aerolatus]
MAETPKGGINEQQLKKCVTGDAIALDQKFKPTIKYAPQAKFIIACNAAFTIKDETDGMFRRFHYIRWDRQFKNSDAIKDLDLLIMEKELHLVVDWCLEGLKALTKRGEFDVPLSVLERNEAEKIANNSVLGFITEFNYVQDHLMAPTGKTEFLQEYNNWCRDNSRSPVNGNNFWKRIKKLFPGLKDSRRMSNGSQKLFINLKVKSLNDDSHTIKTEEIPF